MKRVCVLLLAVLLLLTGCGGQGKIKDVSEKDVSCPYKVSHKKDAVEITVENGDLSGIQWRSELTPEDVCEVVPMNGGREGTSGYRVKGLLEGAAQIRLTALQGDDALFVLTVLIHVDGDGKASVSSCEHWEREGASVTAEGLNYNWNVDENGVLHFSFVNSEDSWIVAENEQEVCTLLEKMATPDGCMFSAEAKSAGQGDILLLGETTQRKISVRLETDHEGKLKVISVQEQ